MLNVCWTFKETAKLFSNMLATYRIPTGKTCEDSGVSTSLPTNTWNVSLFQFSHRMSVEQYLIMALIFISLMTNDVETLFMCLLAIHISSLVKCLSKVKLHMFNLSCCLRTEF